MSKEIVFSSGAPAPIGPYSQAVLAGNLLFVSGQIAVGKSNVKEETEQVMKSMEAILTQAKMGFSNVVKCTIFLKDMNDFAQVNEVYGTFFAKDPPARETVQVARLPKDVNVEISCIAVK